MIASPDVMAPLVVTLVVPCAPDAAFRYFTQDIGTWWPLGTHSVARADAVGCAFEAREGGHLAERSRDGAVHVWGTVTCWQPPQRLAFTWHPGRSADTAQSVDVRFAPHPGGTEVTLVHGGFEALGERANAMREEYRSGWRTVLTGRYAAHARTGAAP